MNRSPLFYVGDKRKLMPQLLQYFPKKINKFIEPFCGGGSVFLNTQADSYLLNDIDSYIIKLHQFLCSYSNKSIEFFIEFEKIIDSYKLSASCKGINVPLDIKNSFEKTYYAVYNRDGYNRLREDFNKDKKDFMRLYALLIYGFNRMIRFNKKGNYNVPVGNVDYNQNVRNALISYFNTVKGKSLEFYNYDYIDFINKIEFGKNDFVYFDPPYLISQSEYNKNWSIDKEVELLSMIDYLDGNGVKFALSNVLYHKGKSNDILLRWSEKYKVKLIESNYISYHDNTKKSTKEVLILNYE